MTGKNCSGFDSPKSHPKQDNKNTFRKQSRMRNSVESIFSCVTNVSDTGTYEIEICERQSHDTCSLSRRAICSKSPIGSDVSRTDIYKCHTIPRSFRSKSDNSIVDPRKPLTRWKNALVQSYYPCFCIATLELKDNPKPKPDLVNKETNTKDTEAEYCGQVSKSVSSSSVISSEKENDEFSSAPDSEKSCTASHCSSSRSSSSGPASSGSASSFRRNKKNSRKTSPTSVTSKSNATISVDTEKSCDCTKCRYGPRESSGTYIVVLDDKKTKESVTEKKTENIFQRMKTVQALELISEEKEKHWAEGAGEFGTCKCEMGRYEERLKNLEDLHLRNKTNGNDEKWNKGSEAESEHHSCECATTLTQFAEIKSRIDALEKLCRDTLGNKPQALKRNKEEQRLEPVEEGSSYTEEEQLRYEMKSLTETLDETARTGIELAKIKKRLMDLEVKMLREKSYHTFSSQSVKNDTSFGKDKKVAVNITTTYITPPNNKLSDKEIQVIDLNEEQNRPARAREDYGFIAENRLAAYWMMKKMNPWSKIVLRDEAIQTPSKKQLEPLPVDSAFCAKSKEKEKKTLKKSCDKIHLCKDCNFYISQKIGRPGEDSLAKLWNSRKLDESLPVKSKKFGSESINKLKKSFNLYQINTSDFLEGRDSKRLSLFNETKRLLEKKQRKERKKLKLCPKCSKTNLKDSVISDFESELEYGGLHPWISSTKKFDKSCDSVNSRNLNIGKDSRKSFRSIRFPHQSFQVYRSQETSHSLLLHPRSSRAKTFSSRHRRKTNYHEDKGLPTICPLWTCYPMKMLYNYHHRPFSYATGYESWEKNTCYTVTASAVKDSMSSYSGSLKKKNRLNPFQYLKAGRKIKIPVLFEEICHSSESKLLEHKSSMSMRVVRVGIKEEGKNDLSPLKKLVRKFSHSQPMAHKEKYIPFGISRCCCDNTAMDNRKTLERQKRTNIFSLVRRCPP